MGHAPGKKKIPRPVGRPRLTPGSLALELKITLSREAHAQLVELQKLLLARGKTSVTQSSTIRAAIARTLASEKVRVG